MGLGCLSVLVLLEDFTDACSEDAELFVGCSTGQLDVPGVSGERKEAAPDVKVHDPVSEAFDGFDALLLVS